jgi:hypothetical protein
VFCILRDVAVDAILESRNQVVGELTGKSPVAKLHQGSCLNESEADFFILVMGRYIMEKCAK